MLVKEKDNVLKEQFEEALGCYCQEKNLARQLMHLMSMQLRLGKELKALIVDTRSRENALKGQQDEARKLKLKQVDYAIEAYTSDKLFLESKRDQLKSSKALYETITNDLRVQMETCCNDLWLQMRREVLYLEELSVSHEEIKSTLFLLDEVRSQLINVRACIQSDQYPAKSNIGIEIRKLSVLLMNLCVEVRDVGFEVYNQGLMDSYMDLANYFVDAFHVDLVLSSKINEANIRIQELYLTICQMSDTASEVYKQTEHEIDIIKQRIFRQK